MPIYGYACNHCGHTLDALQKIADDPLLQCPECDEPALKRQLSAPRFRLKGQGWYETDFKSGNQRNLAGDAEPDKADKPGAEKSGKEESGKEESGKEKSGKVTAESTSGGTSAGSSKSDSNSSTTTGNKKTEKAPSTSKNSAA